MRSRTSGRGTAGVPRRGEGQPRLIHEEWTSGPRDRKSAFLDRTGNRTGGWGERLIFCVLVNNGWLASGALEMCPGR